MELGKYVEGVKSMTRTQWAPRAFDTLSLAFAAFVAGARSVPMGDNGALLRELAARARRSEARWRLEHAAGGGVINR